MILRMDYGVIDKVAVKAVAPVVPVIRAVRFLVVARVVMTCVADSCPAITVTDAGTTAVVLLDASVTTVPPAGATPFNVTVNIDVVPPLTVRGLNPMAAMAGAVTDTFAFTDAPPAVAVIVNAVVTATDTDVATNVAVVAPAATVTVGGTTMAAFDDANVTTNPPAGAGPPIVTVPVTDAPPTTAIGVTASAVTLCVVTTSVALRLRPPPAAVMTTFVVVATAAVVIVNVADVAPAGTITVAGTVAPTPAVTFTTNPPTGAGAVNPTVATLAAPPTTDVNESDKPLT